MAYDECWTIHVPRGALSVASIVHFCFSISIFTQISWVSSRFTRGKTALARPRLLIARQTSLQRNPLSWADCNCWSLISLHINYIHEHPPEMASPNSCNPYLKPLPSPETGRAAYAARRRAPRNSPWDVACELVQHVHRVEYFMVETASGTWVKSSDSWNKPWS